MEEKKFEEQREMDVEREAEKEPEKESQGLPNRSYILMLLAGAYLIYTGCRLCQDVLAGKDGASWGFFAVGAVFMVIGASMIFIGGRGTLRKDKEKRAEEALEETEREETEKEETGQEESMSISQRARLVKPEETEEEE